MTGAASFHDVQCSIRRRQVGEEGRIRPETNLMICVCGCVLAGATAGNGDTLQIVAGTATAATDTGAKYPELEANSEKNSSDQAGSWWRTCQGETGREGVSTDRRQSLRQLRHAELSDTFRGLEILGCRGREGCAALQPMWFAMCMMCGSSFPATILS